MSSDAILTQSQTSHALVVCDMQPDLLQSLPAVDRQMLLEMVQIALCVARQAGWNVVFTGLRFQDGYRNVPPQHRLYGALSRLHAKLGTQKVHWFLEGYDGSKIHPSLLALVGDVEKDNVHFVWRSSHLPSTQLVEILSGMTHVTVVGIKASTSVQATCQYLCDQGLDVSTIRECVGDDVAERFAATVDHLIPTYANVLSLVDFIDHAVGFVDPYDSSSYAKVPTSTCNENSVKIVSYCCNVGRGGHASLYMAHLLQRPEWRPYPKQKWYDDFVKSYYCPLGKRVVDFCDEPKFSSVSVFIKGRESLDEKDKLLDFAGELMPETYLIQNGQWIHQPAVKEEEENDRCWFVKQVNKNGGRAVQICPSLSDCMALTDRDSVYAVQQHIRDPLLTDDGRKCHVKFYSLLQCSVEGQWKLYTYKESFLSTSPNQWSPTDISCDTQITIKRHQRLKFDKPVVGWENQSWPTLYKQCKEAVAQIVGRAIDTGKLSHRKGQGQFEIFSADFMWDTSGKLWIIEFNFSPVLYDPMYHNAHNANLVTSGLKAYDKQYRIHGKKVEINDHNMIRDAVSMMFYPESSLPPNTCWDSAGQFCSKEDDATE